MKAISVEFVPRATCSVRFGVLCCSHVMSCAPVLVDALGRERRHRDRHVLQRFLAAARGDRDFLERPAAFAGDGRVLREHGRHGEHRCGEGGGLRRVDGKLLHDSPCLAPLLAPNFQRPLKFS